MQIDTYSDTLRPTHLQTFFPEYTIVVIYIINIDTS